MSVECLDTRDAAFYSIEGPVYPFLLDCPPGYDCRKATSFNMFCCDQWISVPIPAGSSDADILLLVTSVVNQCAVRQSFCGTGNGPNSPPDPPPHPPPTIYRNTPQTCTVKCPDGLVFTFTVVAGTVGESNQNLANATALRLACEQAEARKMCIGSFPAECCVGTAFSHALEITGGVAPITLTLSGLLPTGLNLDPATGIISGTPSSGNSFTFTITATEAGGGFMSKVFAMCAVDISPPGSTLPAGQVGTPLTVNFTATSCAVTPYSWQVVSGTLPPGTALVEATGVLSGTPTTSGTYNFTIKFQDKAT